MENGIMDFFNNMQFKLDTQLGSKFDNGIQLSGGEWQQLAFARAILRRADLLILDEPSSGLDVFTEEDMYNLLDNESKDLICLIVTHRLYIINQEEYRAIVFKNGEIIEDDKACNLLKNDSYYKYILNKVQKDLTSEA